MNDPEAQQMVGCGWIILCIGAAVALIIAATSLS